MDRGSDQRLGKGIFALTLDTLPDVIRRGIESGISSFVSYTQSATTHKLPLIYTSGHRLTSVSSSRPSISTQPSPICA
jgi:hypothetical protein